MLTPGAKAQISRGDLRRDWKSRPFKASADASAFAALSSVCGATGSRALQSPHSSVFRWLLKLAITASGTPEYWNKLMRSLKAGNFFLKKGVSGKVSLQASQHFQGAGLVFFSHIGDGQKNSGKWREVMSIAGGQFKV